MYECSLQPAQVTMGNTRFARAWLEHTKYPSDRVYLDQVGHKRECSFQRRVYLRRKSEGA